MFHPGLFNLNQVFGPKSLNNYLNSCSSTSEKAEVETPGQVVWNMELPPKEMLVTLHPQSSPQQLQTLPAIPAHRQLQQPFSLNGKMKGLIPFPTCISLKHSSSTKGLQSGQKLIAALKPLPFLWALMLL